MRRKALQFASISLMLALAGACSTVPSITPPPAVGASAEATSPPAATAPAAATTPPAPTAPGASDFRKTPPLPGADIVFQAPKIAEARLPNGVRVLVVERHDLPIVAVSIAINRGADQADPGVGSFLGSMLLAGTKTRSAFQISDDLGGLGASYNASVSMDDAEISAQCLTPKLGAMMLVLADIVRNPAFDSAEIDRERSRRLTALSQENDSPRRLLSNLVGEALYPSGHPYAVSLLGTEKALAKISKSDLERFHAAHFAPQHATIAFAGDVTPELALAEATRAFGKWQGNATRAEVPPAPPSSGTGARIEILDRPGSAQSSVALALPGAPRSSPDFDAITVMNTILGGQFSSRINMNLREKHAYTYGARSTFDWRHGPGPFTAGGEIFTESTEPAIRELLAELERMRTELVSEQELSDAKQNLIKQLPARFESSRSTAATVAALSTYGLSLDEFATRPARFGAVTRDEIRDAAKKYLPADRLKILVVGDAKVIKPGLEKLGLGRVEVRKPSK